MSGGSRLVEVWRFTRKEPDMPWLLVNPETNLPYTGLTMEVFVARGRRFLRQQEEHAQREGAEAPADQPEPQGEQAHTARVELRQHEDGLLYDHVHGPSGPVLVVANEDMWHQVPLAIPINYAAPFDHAGFTQKLFRHTETALVDVAARKEQATTTCAICSSKLGIYWVYVLMCGHKFHTECMEEWWDATELDSCPICEAASA